MNKIDSFINTLCEYSKVAPISRKINLAEHSLRDGVASTSYSTKKSIIMGIYLAPIEAFINKINLATYKDRVTALFARALAELPHEAYLYLLNLYICAIERISLQNRRIYELEYSELDYAGESLCNCDGDCNCPIGDDNIVSDQEDSDQEDVDQEDVDQDDVDQEDVDQNDSEN